MTANSLSELFNNTIFRIPDYQRGYSWEEKQLIELWDDIEDITSDNNELKKYYVGTIYLEATQGNESEKWLSTFKFYNVVDGQQRLTTIIILIFELLKLAKSGYCDESKEDLEKTYLFKVNNTGNNKIYKFSYSENDKNFNYLLKNIFEDPLIILGNSMHNHYSHNLMSAKKFFKLKLENLNDQERELIFKKLTTSLQFDIRKIEKDLDVQAVFETMNNRGKPLSTLEKLKNRLIYLTEKLKCSSEDKLLLRKKINDAWGKIYTCLAQNPETLLDEDVFLSAHLSLYRKPKDAVFSENLAEEKVFQMFCNKSEKHIKDDGLEYEEPVDYNKIENYILKLSEVAPIWYEIHNSKLKAIKKILIMNSSKEIKIFLLALFNKTQDLDVIANLLENLENILFRNRIPGIGIIDERSIATWARDIYSDEETLDGIGSKQTELLNTGINVDNIINSFRYLFTYERGPKGFHRWSALKYFLFEYENFLKYKARETNDKITLDDYDVTTIEHVIPQHFWHHWLEEVNEFTDGIEEIKLNQAQKVIINTLGNLTILKNGKNSSLGNNSWEVKRDRFTTGSYNEIEISKNTSWKKENIADRGTQMLKFLESKVRGLQFTRIDIERILNYDDELTLRFSSLKTEPDL